MKRLICLVTALVVHGGVLAQSETEEIELLSLYGDEEFISIATGNSQPLHKAPAVASIITYDDIVKLGVRDFDGVLEMVPGLHVARDALGYNPIYTFRGIYSTFNPQVLMLVNGIPLTNLFYGDRNQAWGGMPVEAISRVEIIRGPGSALYGADAFAGVINIITKSGGEIGGLNVGYRQGSFNTKDTWLSYGEKFNNNLEVSFVVEYSESDGQDEIISADAQTLLDSYFLTNASLAPGSVSLERDTLDIRGEIKKGNLTVRSGYQFREGGNGAGIAQALDPTNQISSKRINFDIGYVEKDLFKNWMLSGQISGLRTTQEIEKDLILYPAGSTGPFIPPIGVFTGGVIGNPEVYEKHYRASLDISSMGFDMHEFRAGAGYYHGDVYKTEEERNFGLNPFTNTLIMPGDSKVDVSDTPVVFLPEDDRESGYVYVQDVWQVANDWELTAGLRYDHYNDFGDTVNPRLALVWSTSRNLTTKLLYGEAFRAPSFAETRVSSNPVFLGNPELDPEELKSYEVAFDYRPTYGLTLNLNAFYYKWEDIIQFVADSGGSTRTAQNSGEQTGHGVEFEVHWQATKHLEFTSNYSWQKSTDENLDADSGNAPEKQLYLRADWDISDLWNVNVQTNWVMDRNRVEGDPRSDVDNYALVDLTIRRKSLWDHIDIALIVKNVFNEDAREPSPNGSPVPAIPNDLPLAGQAVLGEVRYRF